MLSNCINNLLNLKGVKIKNIKNSDFSIDVYIETKPKDHVCPCCGSKTHRIHDYRNQSIKDLPIQFKSVNIILRKRRYVCSCGKKFSEHYDFLPKYHRMTNRLAFYIITELKKTKSMKEISSTTNVSISTVMRLFNYVNYGMPKLPTVLSIDEFKGNTNAGKYQCILVDVEKKKVIDILPDRCQSHLINYFTKYSRQERKKVKFFVCDMWQPYTELAKALFPNATIIIDKYHFIRQVTWAIENVRKRLQKQMSVDLRRYYKRSRKLILTRHYKLSDDNKRALEIMLLYNDDLRLAHHLKEWFYEICQSKDYLYQVREFNNWIKDASSCGIKEFEQCAKTYINWHNEILNAFKYGYTNGPTEGFNNKIKVLKRISFGVRNFDRFRNRILHCFN